MSAYYILLHYTTLVKALGMLQATLQIRSLFSKRETVSQDDR